MGLFTDECPNCKATVRKNLNYCSSCGKPLGRGDRTCAKCGNGLSAGAKFCPSCGEAAEIAPAAIDRRTWGRGDKDFAVRIEISDLPGFIKKDLVVEHGTKAMIFQNGKLVETVPAGKYSLDNFFTSFRLLNKNNPAHAVVVDAGDVEIELGYDGLFTSDQIPVGVKALVRLQIDKPEVFFFNLMKNRNRFTLDDIRSRLVDETRNIFQSRIKTEAIDALYGNLELKRDLQEAVEAEMRRSLERDGLRIVNFTAFDYVHERFDGLKARTGENKLGDIERNLELSEREKGLRHELAKGAQDVSFDAGSLDLAARRADLEEKRLSMVSRLRELLTKDKIENVRSEADFQKAIFETDRLEVLREQDINDLREEYRRNSLQREKDHELEIKRKEDDHDLGHVKKWSDLELDQMKKERNDALDSLAKLKQLGQNGDKADMELELERERRKVEIDRSRAEIEQMRLQVRSQASVEALMSVLGNNLSRELLEAMKMNAQKGMSVEQILATQAKDHPEVARIFQEKERAVVVERDRLMDQQKEYMEKLERISDRGADRVERIAHSAAGRPAVVPAYGDPTAYNAGGQAGKTLICPDCKWECAPNAKYCPSCGAALTHREK